MQESQSEVDRLQKQKEELCAQIRDLSLPVDLASDSLPDLKKQLRLLESEASERAQEITSLTTKIQQQQQVLRRHANKLRYTLSLLAFFFLPRFSLFSGRYTCALRWRWRG